MKQSGWVDFSLPSKKWVTECTHDGENLAKHFNCFDAGEILPPVDESDGMKRWILSDFRWSILKKRRGLHLLAFLFFFLSTDTTLFSIHWLLIDRSDERRYSVAFLCCL